MKGPEGPGSNRGRTPSAKWLHLCPVAGLKCVEREANRAVERGSEVGLWAVSLKSGQARTCDK